MLAARWEHRLSTDIDVLLPGRNTLIQFVQEDEANLARRLGGSLEAGSGNRIKIAFAHGKLDVSTLRPNPGMAEREARVDGKAEIVLSSSQILRGKLERVTKLAVRDVIDVRVAAAREPGALATAVNMLGSEAAAAVAELWRAADKSLEERFNEDNVASSLTERRTIDQRRLGTDAAQALMDHRYRHLVVEVDGESLTIRRWVAQGPLAADEYKRREAADALIESGIGVHLNQNGPIGAPALLKAIRVAERQGRHIVYDNTDSTCPAMRIRTGHGIEPQPRPQPADGHTPPGRARKVDGQTR